MAELEIKMDEQIPERDIGNILLPLYNNAWAWCDPVNFNGMESRFRGPNKVIVVYDDIKEGEEFNQGDLRFPLNLKEYAGGRVPIAAINGMPFLTRGDCDQIPQKFQHIFGQGEHYPDTMLFYSLIALPSRRGKKGKGELNFLMRAVCKHFETRVDHIYTYTPNKEKIWQTHVKRGARDTGVIKRDSRVPINDSDIEEYSSLIDTRIMDYMPPKAA
jgi:hypothetical protein